MQIPFEELPESLQDFLAKPPLGAFIDRFLESKNKNTPGLANQVSEYIDSCIYGSISIQEMLVEIQTLCTLSDADIEEFFATFLEVLDEAGLNALEKYPVNQERDADEDLFTDIKTNSQTKTDQLETSVSQDPKTVQVKLLKTLEQFNLHVDDKGIIAHEVERYLKGEILSKDLEPHLVAMLDKPFSEVHTIVISLNENIFKPIQKQIAEEGTLDISYDNDESLQNFLVQKKSVDILPQSKIGGNKPLDIKTISFLPKNISQVITQQKKSDIVLDLQTLGGTPNGTSLLSQEIKKEQIAKPQDSKTETEKTKPVEVKKYTIDPYRENVE